VIEDKELRDLFKVESEEHLQHLDRGLLELEKDPQNQALLDEVFRGAHSLKGGARMLALGDIEAIAHRFESILGAARKGEMPLTLETIDQLYRALDAIRRQVNEAITGEPAGVAIADTLAMLRLSKEAPPEEEDISSLEAEAPAAGLPEPQPEVGETGAGASPEPEALASSPVKAPPEPKPAEAVAVPEASIARAGEKEETLSPKVEAVSSTHGKFRIETLRVATEKLDALMTQVGELSVTKNRVAHSLARIEEITGVWEKLSRGGVSLRSLLQEMGLHHHDGFLKKLMDYHCQEIELLGRLGVLLNGVKTAAYEDSSKLDYVADELEGGVRALRLLPLSTIFNLFPRMVRDLARTQSKEVQLLTEGDENTADKRVIEEMKDPLMHLIRNAMDHGIESPEERERLGKPRQGSIRLKAFQTASNIFLEVQDDGRGLDLEAIKRTVLKKKLYRAEDLEAMTPAEIRSLIFLLGFSTSTFVSDVSGRGVGLDVVRANVERLKGSIQIDSATGQGCTFRVQLPITMATARVLIVGVSGMKYAMLVEYVEASHLVFPQEIFTIEGHGAMVIDGRPVSVARLADLLELRGTAPPEHGDKSKDGAGNPCVILAMGDERLGLLVDELLDEQEIVLKTQSKLLQRVRNVSGATILGTGEVCILLNPQDLMRSVRRRDLHVAAVAPAEVEERKKVILMAEDSLTTRTQMKRILEGDGYEVVVAVDGLEAFNKIGTRPFDALVSDILMPNLDGLALTEKVRQDTKYRELPIILVTSLASEEDKKRGLEAGANAYITKPAFDQKVLLDTLRRLI
jgi:two-component system chemotaxis sensor kinase CheA